MINAAFLIFLFGMSLQVIGSFTIGYWQGADSARKILKGYLANNWKGSETRIVIGWGLVLLGLILDISAFTSTWAK